MNTRKTILSAMSLIASMSIFATGPASAEKETKSEVAPAVQKTVETHPYAEKGYADETSAKRDENAAAVAGVMTALTPAYTEKEEARKKVDAERFQKQLEAQAKREAEEKKRQEEELRRRSTPEALNSRCETLEKTSEEHGRNIDSLSSATARMRKELEIQKAEIKRMNEENSARWGGLKNLGSIIALAAGFIVGRLIGSKSKPISRDRREGNSY